MPGLGFFQYAVAATMSAVAVWRLPAVLYGDSHRRALWSCYAGFAIALWIKSPAIKDWLNHSPVTDLSILLKHYVSTAAILAILTFVVASYGSPEGCRQVPRHVAVARWVERSAYKASLGAMALMTLLFFTVVDRSSPSVNFVPEHAGQWGATAYMTVFYLYLAAATSVCGYQWYAAQRWAESFLMRLGLGLMAVSMALAFVYTALRVGFLWVAIVDTPSLSVSHMVGDYTSALQIAVFFLFAAGVSVPSSKAAHARVKASRALRHLYPLWRDLMTAFPDIPLQKPAPRWREAIRMSPPLAVRLDRWIQDIADAVEALRHYAPADLFFVAEMAAVGSEDPRPAAEAYWLRAALCAATAGERSKEASPALPSKAISDTETEASWLMLVNDEYGHLTSVQGRALLKAARSEEYSL